MKKKYLKNVLAGFSIAGLVAGAGVTFSPGMAAGQSG